MPRTCDIILGGRFMGLFVGPSGTGKTIAAASFPGPMMIYDFDSRVDPVRLFYPKREDIEYKTVAADARGRRDVIGFREFCQEFEDLQDRCPYEAVVIDSYTSLSATTVNYNLGHNVDKKLSKGGLPIPYWDEFKAETGTALQIIEVAKALPCHVIFTAHPVTKMETKAGQLESMQRVQSIACYGTKTPSFLPNYFNEYYYFYTVTSSQVGQKPRRHISTVSQGEFPAKTALPLPPTIEITDKPLYNVLQAILAEFEIKLQEKAAKQGGVVA